MFVNSSIPAIKSLNKEFMLHTKTKSLRCKMPIINMKKNIFNDQKEIQKDSSAFSSYYENLRYDNSPPVINDKKELGIDKGDQGLKSKVIEGRDLEHMIH